jgi:MATE family multidrug resistance protein
MRLALPLVAFNVGTQLMAAVDTALAGRINALAQAATGLGNVVFFAGALLGIGIAMGIDPLTSQAFGARREDVARHVLWQSVWVCLAVSAPIMIVTYLAGRTLEGFGIEPALAAETRRFLDPRILSLLPMFWLTAMRSYLQSAHRTRAILLATVIANVFNLGAACMLVFGDRALAAAGLPALGVPELGVAGLGWATTLATLLNLAIFALAIGRDARSAERFDAHAIEVESDTEALATRGARIAAPQSRLPQWSTIASILALGLPIGAHMLAEVGIFSVAGLLAGRMGKVEMAAHQVALQLAALAFMVPLGVGAATSVRVGRAIGAGDDASVRVAGLAGITVGAAFMSVSAVSMWTLSPLYARLMATDPAVIALASQLILIAGAFQLFDGIQVVSAGALRGAGLTRWTMAANLVAYWLVAFPLVLALGLGMDFGPRGIWWGLTIGLGVAAALLSVKFAAVSRGPVARLETA